MRYPVGATLTFSKHGLPGSSCQSMLIVNPRPEFLHVKVIYGEVSCEDKTLGAVMAEANSPEIGLYGMGWEGTTLTFSERVTPVSEYLRDKRMGVSGYDSDE